MVFQQAKALTRKGWARFKKVVDWADKNARYIAAILSILTALGITGPETMGRVKQAVLGDDLASAVEVVDNAG